MNVLLLSLISFFMISWSVSALESDDVIGVWECEKFPKGLKAKMKMKDTPMKCVVEIKKNGSFIASGFVMRDPYRIENFRGSWKIVPGKMTPSGRDSLYLNGHFFTGSKKGGTFRLEYLICGMDEYQIEFSKKAEKK